MHPYKVTDRKSPALPLSSTTSSYFLSSAQTSDPAPYHHALLTTLLPISQSTQKQVRIREELAHIWKCTCLCVCVLPSLGYHGTDITYPYFHPYFNLFPLQ